MNNHSRKKPRVIIPKPDRIRCPSRTGFGWLEARLLKDGWLNCMPPESCAAYAFLCLAGNRQGISWYRRDRISLALGIEHSRLRKALERLIQLDLIAYKAFGSNATDGFHQVLSVPPDGPPEDDELFFS